ncbi:MAG: DNA repair protein RecN, partial [Solobacterium sp.]|nr:DNA repair protein RecN [Solobacterium sp.]
KDAYQTYFSLVKEKETILNDTFNETDLEYFQYQVQEIEEANLKEGEEEALQDKEKQYEAVKDSYDKISQSILTFNELDSSLYELNKLIQSLPNIHPFNSIKEQFTNHYYEMSDSIDSLKKEQDGFEFTEDDINAIEERLFTIQKLKRKYGRSIEEIQQLKDDLLKKIEMMNHRNDYLEEMDQKISIAYNIYIDLAKKLSSKRLKGSKKLDEAVMKHLKDLALPNARFKTEIKEMKETSLGIDDVEFFISMNVGEELAPLIKTASGGELSRLMLGLKVIFTHLQGIETVIFDEIDTGVSGNVASLIGQKMKELSKDTQVLTVTHLAPVASFADHHYLVTKSSTKNSTSTNVLTLSENETIEQLALLSSGEVTETSLAAAKELYRRSHS